VRPGGGLQFVGVSTQPTPTVGDPILIATLSTGGGSAGPRNYDRTLDGAKFVVFAQAGAGGPIGPQIQVVLNWFEELKARVPTGK
jgi:hypothetical protein